MQLRSLQLLLDRAPYPLPSTMLRSRHQITQDQLQTSPPTSSTREYLEREQKDTGRGGGNSRAEGEGGVKPRAAWTKQPAIPIRPASPTTTSQDSGARPTGPRTSITREKKARMGMDEREGKGLGKERPGLRQPGMYTWQPPPSCSPSRSPLRIPGASPARPLPSHRATAIHRAHTRNVIARCTLVSPRALAAAAPPPSTVSAVSTQVDTRPPCRQTFPGNRIVGPPSERRAPPPPLPQARAYPARWHAAPSPLSRQAGPCNELGRRGSIRVGHASLGLCDHDPTACVSPIRAHQSAHGRHASMCAGCFVFAPSPNVGHTICAPSFRSTYITTDSTASAAKSAGTRLQSKALREGVADAGRAEESEAAHI
ncbi:hypothetical protein FIBSPDRAFT_932733 [Athelia psychrophila]|uniref:Uncharacterized protein n=1 Tax=Athelia psychrophila TaxID=1759441 RepID=A0A166IAC9_9AGAM|nr:hypothetical protein FIBSPDRAFT_932733 [Fibularhizoctonia sp. CBS 109695]